MLSIAPPPPRSGRPVDLARRRAVLEAAGGVAVPGPLEHGIVTAFERLEML